MLRFQTPFRGCPAQRDGGHCMNGIDNGYLNLSPFEDLMLAMTMQTTFRKPKNMTIGIPIIIKHKGIERNT